MRPDLYNIPGTVAYVLKQHSDELNNLMGNQSQYQQLKQRVYEILDKHEEYRNPNDAIKAKDILKSCEGNKAKFLSTLTTYMLGMKVI